MTEPAKPALIRRLLIAGAFAATFAAGGVAFNVAPALADAHGMGMMRHGMGGEHGGGMAMMGGHVDKMLDAADATPEQKAKIQAILGNAFGQLHALHAELGATHGKLHALLTAPTIDRGAIEALRADAIGKVDDGSKVVTKALADAAEVLTPAQRAKLGAAMAAHHKGG